MLWDTKQYLLIEFIFILISTVYFILKHCKLPVLFIQSRTNNSFVGPTQTPLSLSSLWFFGALIGFIGFESFFFLVVGSSKELGFFGQFHVFLWTLLETLGVGVVEMIKTVARTLYGFANAAACREDQLEEDVEICLVGGRRIGYRTIGNYWEIILLEIVSSKIIPLEIVQYGIVLLETVPLKIVPLEIVQLGIVLLEIVPPKIVPLVL